MRSYGLFNESEGSIFPITDKIIGAAIEYIGEWSSAYISGEILTITMVIDGVSVDKSADLGGVEFTGLITSGLNNNITAIELTIGTAILYK